MWAANEALHCACGDFCQLELSLLGGLFAGACTLQNWSSKLEQWLKALQCTELAAACSRGIHVAGHNTLKTSLDIELPEAELASRRHQKSS